MFNSVVIVAILEGVEAVVVIRSGKSAAAIKPIIMCL